MKKELEDKLFKKYPKIFPKGRNIDPHQSLMCFGLEGDSGWYWLIDQLCSCIQSYIDGNKHLKIKQVVAAQVKEKFAQLRFYTDGHDENIGGMIWLAEHMSGSICEKCGSFEGKIDEQARWIKCLCDECRKDKQKEDLDRQKKTIKKLRER